MTTGHDRAGAPEDRDREVRAGAPEEPADGPRAEPGDQPRAEPGDQPRAEPTDRPRAEPTPGDDVAEDLEALLEDVKRERDEYLDLARRAKADFENYRKRAAREAADAERRGKAALARELVPSIDNLERALAAAEEGSEVARGVGLVHGELQATLARAGVESYDPSGERFDPTLHEAISTMPATEAVESGTVVETLECGYRLNGQVLRPARVVVSE